MTSPLWQPSAKRVSATEIARLCADLELQPTYSDLHRFSIGNPERFWATIWDRYGIIGERTDEIIRHGDRLRTTRFFPEARLNVAENVLSRFDHDARIEAASADAITFSNEGGRKSSMSWTELSERVSTMQQAMRRAGVGVGDVVAAWLPNIPEAIVIFLAANSLGAIFTSSSPDFGTAGVVDRFGQIAPKLLFATDAYLYAGKQHDTSARLAEITDQLDALELTVLVPYLDPDATVAGTLSLGEFVAGLVPEPLRFERVDFDHPVFVLFSSGTTGAPKAIVHRSGGVLMKLVSEHRLHCDIHPGDRVFYFTTTGWMMWNWLTLCLASGATVVLYDGSPFHPSGDVLFDLVDRERVTLFGISAKFVDALNKNGLRPAQTHDLSSIRTICSTGSTLVHESFRFVYEHIKTDVHLASMSGGTDLCGCLVAGDPTSPVYIGEIQAPAVGLDIAVVDDMGARLDAGRRGELVCLNAFPSIPLEFVDDDGDVRFDASYFERIPGAWHQGDFAEWSAGGGMIISGRSDSTLNAGGVRIGTAEIYRQVERLAEVEESIVIGQEWDDDTRIVLFVRAAQGVELDEGLDQLIRQTIRDGASPRHVPARIVQVSDIPRTRSGKISELAVRDVVHGRDVENTEALANPDSLEQFRNRPELAT